MDPKRGSNKDGNYMNPKRGSILDWQLNEFEERVHIRLAIK